MYCTNQGICTLFCVSKNETGRRLDNNTLVALVSVGSHL